MPSDLLYLNCQDAFSGPPHYAIFRSSIHRVYGNSWRPSPVQGLCNFAFLPVLRNSLNGTTKNGLKSTMTKMVPVNSHHRNRPAPRPSPIQVQALIFG